MLKQSKGRQRASNMLKQSKGRISKFIRMTSIVDIHATLDVSCDMHLYTIPFPK